MARDEHAAVRAAARDPSPASSRSTSRPGSRSARRRSSSGRASTSRRRPCGPSSPSSSGCGLLTHPHTSAGRVPTEAGYRVYVDELLARQRAAAAASSRSSSPAARAEVEEALQATTEIALAGDAAARARLGAAARGSDRPPRRGAPAPAERRDGRRDHVDRRRLEAALRFAEPVDPGLVIWAGDYLARAARSALRLRSRLLARGVRRAEPRRSRERSFLDGDPRRVRRGRGGAPALRRRRGRAARRPPLRGDRRLPQPDRRAREARGAARRPGAVARPAPPVRPRRRRARAVRPARRSRSSARRYGLANQTLGTVSLLGPLRMDYEKALRSVRAAAHELSRFVEEVYAGRVARRERGAHGHRRWHHVRPHGDDRTRLLRAARRLARRRRAGDQEGVPRARARAAPRRLGAIPRPRCGSARCPRPTRCSRTPRRASSTTATATPASARAASRRPHFDLGNLGDLFSAFFGDDLFGGGRGRRAARGADVAAEVEIDLVEAARGVKRDGRRSRSPSRARRAAATASSPGTTVTTCRRCGGAGRLQQVSRSVFGEFVRTRRAPSAAAPGSIDRASVRDVRAARAARSRSASSTVDDPGRHPRRPADPRSPARVTRARSAAVPATSTSLVRVRPDERFVREGNDIFSQVDLTIVQAALGATVHGRDARRPGRARVRAGHAAGRGARAARAGDAGAPGLRPRRPARARQRRRCRAG